MVPINAKKVFAAHSALRTKRLPMLLMDRYSPGAAMVVPNAARLHCKDILSLELEEAINQECVPNASSVG